jgi:hypothetical protein
MAGQSGTDDLLIIPLALIKFQPDKPGALADGEFRIRRQIAILLRHPVKGTELKRSSRPWRLAARRKRHETLVGIKHPAGHLLGLQGSTGEGTGNHSQDNGGDSGSFHIAPRLPLHETDFYDEFLKNHKMCNLTQTVLHGS